MYAAALESAGIDFDETLIDKTLHTMTGSVKLGTKTITVLSDEKGIRYLWGGHEYNSLDDLKE